LRFSFAPWKSDEAYFDLSSVLLTAPAFNVNDLTDKNIKTFIIQAPHDIPDNDFSYIITGNCLTAKRWVSFYGFNK